MQRLAIVYAGALVLLTVASADNPIKDLARLGPCLETTNPPECNTTIVGAFQLQNKVYGDNEENTYFYLFTPSSREKAEPLHQCGGHLPEDTTFDTDARTVVIIHGWLDGVCRTAWMREMKEQFFNRMEADSSTKYNVILVDWSWGNFPDYKEAGMNCRVVGEQTGFVISNIIRSKKVNASQFYVVGHSFGAIASGYVSRTISRFVHQKLGRITALDPAYSPYGNAPPEKRVTHRDANFVDVIHSNAFQCFAEGVGDSRFLGHVDFYPNGGKVQLACYPYIAISLLKGDILYALASLEPRLCPHLQSLQYFKESINPPNNVQYVGIAAASYENFNKQIFSRGRNKFAVMGLDCEKYLRPIGIRKMYFLNTTLNCPYYDNSYLNKNVKFPFNTSVPGK